MYVMLTTPAIWAQFLALLLLIRACAPETVTGRWPGMLFGTGWLCAGFALALLLSQPALTTAPLWPSGPLPRSVLLTVLGLMLCASALGGPPSGPLFRGLVAGSAAYGLADHYELTVFAMAIFSIFLALPPRYRPRPLRARFRNGMVALAGLGLLFFVCGFPGLRAILPWALLTGTAIACCLPLSDGRARACRHASD